METDPADTDPADEVKLSPPDPLVVKRPNAHDLSAGQDNQHPPVSPDLQFSLFELLGLMAGIQAVAPNAKIVAFGPHVDHELLAKATKAGCVTLSNGEFNQRYVNLLQGLLSES